MTVALALVLAAAPAGESPAVARCSVFVHVYDAETGSPVPGARVRFLDTGDSAVTDSSGFCVHLYPRQLPSCAAGVRARDYEDAATRSPVLTPTGDWVYVFSLVPTGMRTIRGCVLSRATGGPIAGSEVAIAGALDTTDARGEYVLQGLRPGVWLGTAQADGHWTSAETCRTKPDAGVHDFLLYDTSTAVVRGVVARREDSLPLRRTPVWLSGAGTLTVTDDSGKYALPVPEPCSVVVEAQNGRFIERSQPVQVGRRGRVAVDLFLSGSCRLQDIIGLFGPLSQALLAVGSVYRISPEIIEQEGGLPGALRVVPGVVVR